MQQALDSLIPLLVALAVAALLTPAVSRLARAAILGSPLPDAVSKAVAEAYEPLAGRRLAVRSSATIEDGTTSSFARGRRRRG